MHKFIITRRLQMLRIELFVSVVLALNLTGPSFEGTAYALDESPFNVDFFCGWGGCYRPMEWTPVEIGIASTLTEPFAGSVTLSAQQDGLNTLNIVHTFVLTPDIPLHLPLVTKFAFTADKCSVRLRNERGRTRWSFDFDLWNFSTRNRLLKPVRENDLLIGLVGSGKFGLLRLPQQSICQSHTGRGKVFLGDKLPRMVPWDWTGFVCLDLLILYNPDWNLLNEHQLNAIVKWVSNGGKLMLVLGSHPLPRDNPIAQILPVELQDVKQVTIGTRILAEWGLQASKTETVTAWSMTPKTEALFYETQTNSLRDSSRTTGESLFAAGYAGFGRVGVLAFDPSDMTDKQRVNSARFWVGRIAEILEDTFTLTRDEGQETGDVNRQSILPLPRSIRFVENADSIPDDSRNQQQYEVGWAQAANNAVMEYLYSISEMRPLSIWWVILLLTTLAVLLGPVDYKLLKRRGRLPLTWLTCSCWIVAFSVGAYYGVQALRGGKMQLRAVSVLDGIEDSNCSWSTNYCGLFAPYSDDYQFKGLEDNQWWSGIAPTQQTIWAYNREAGSRKIYCYQHDGGNLPYSIPINIWTIQCLLNESPLERLPLKAQLQRNGDEVILQLLNESDTPILNGYVLFGNNRGINFGPVQANAGREFRSKLHTLRVWETYNVNRYRKYYNRSRDYSANYKSEDAYFAQGCLRRTQAINAYLARGAAMVCARYDNAPVSFEVKGPPCNYNHIQLVRLVVFPQKEKEVTKND